MRNLTSTNFDDLVSRVEVEMSWEDLFDGGYSEPLQDPLQANISQECGGGNCRITFNQLFSRDLINHHLFSFVTETKSLISLRSTCRILRDYVNSTGSLQVKLDVGSYMQKYGIKMDRKAFLKTIIQGFPTTSSITINSFAYLSDLHLFSNLKSIVFEENITGRISESAVCWPNTLTHLEMNFPHTSTSAWRCLENIPKSVVSLNIRNGYNIRLVTRDLKLQHLRYEGEINNGGELCALPNTLTSLEILFAKTSRVTPSFLYTLPASLLDLRVAVNTRNCIGIAWTLNSDCFPKNLRSLRLSRYRENERRLEVAVTGLPSKLSILDIELKNCISMRLNDLPPTLRSLRLVSANNSPPLNLKLLPSSLQYVDLRECHFTAFNFHSNLRYITIKNATSTTSLSVLNLPPQLKYLHLDSVPTMDADKFELLPRHLWGLVLLNVLTVELSCEQIGKLPPSLRYFECNTLSTSSATIALEKLQFMDRKSFCQKLDRAFWNFLDTK